MNLEFRRIGKNEKRLLDFLIAKSKIPLDLPKDWEERLWVATLDHMGGLRLRIEPDDSEDHGPDYPVSACCFDDMDGVPVYAMLFLLRKDDHLYELDLWKVNDEPLIKIADEFEEDKEFFLLEEDEMLET